MKLKHPASMDAHSETHTHTQRERDGVGEKYEIHEKMDLKAKVDIVLKEAKCHRWLYH